MSKDEAPERPKIYFTARGERYIKARELLRSKRGRAAIKRMAQFAHNRGVQLVRVGELLHRKRDAATAKNMAEPSLGQTGAQPLQKNSSAS